MSFFSAGNLLTLGIIALAFILYHQLTRRSGPGLSKLREYVKAQKEELAAFVAEKETAVRDLGTILDVDQKSAAELLNRINLTSADLKQKAAAIAQIDERITAYDSALEELIRMTGRVEENMKRIQDEEAFVESAAKLTGEARTKLDALEKELAGAGARFEAESGAALEKAVDSALRDCKSSVSDLESTLETMGRRVDDHREAVERLERDREENFAAAGEAIRANLTKAGETIDGALAEAETRLRAALDGALAEAGQKADKMEDAALSRLREQALERVKRYQEIVEERLKGYQDSTKTRLAEAQDLVRDFREAWRKESGEIEAKGRAWHTEMSGHIAGLEQRFRDLESRVSGETNGLEQRLEETLADAKARAETLAGAELAAWRAAVADEESRFRALIAEWQNQAETELAHLEAAAGDSLDAWRRTLTGETERNHAFLAERDAALAENIAAREQAFHDAITALETRVQAARAGIEETIVRAESLAGAGLEDAMTKARAGAEGEFERWREAATEGHDRWRTGFETDAAAWREKAAADSAAFRQNIENTNTAWQEHIVTNNAAWQEKITADNDTFRHHLENTAAAWQGEVTAGNASFRSTLETDNTAWQEKITADNITFWHNVENINTEWREKAKADNDAFRQDIENTNTAWREKTETGSDAFRGTLETDNAAWQNRLDSDFSRWRADMETAWAELRDHADTDYRELKNAREIEDAEWRRVEAAWREISGGITETLDGMKERLDRAERENVETTGNLRESLTASAAELREALATLAGELRTAWESSSTELRDALEKTSAEARENLITMETGLRSALAASGAELHQSLADTVSKTGVKALEDAESRLESYRAAQAVQFHALEQMANDAARLEGELRRYMDDTETRVRQDFTLFESTAAQDRGAAQAAFDEAVENLRGKLAAVERQVESLKAKAYENVSAKLDIFEEDFAQNLTARDNAIQERLETWLAAQSRSLADIGEGLTARREELELSFAEEMKARLAEQREKTAADLERLKSETEVFEEAIRDRLAQGEESLESFKTQMTGNLAEARNSADAQVKAELGRFSLAMAENLKQARRDMEEWQEGISAEVRETDQLMEELRRKSRELSTDSDERLAAVRASIAEVNRQIQQFIDQTKLFDQAGALKTELERKIEDLKSDMAGLDQRRAEAAELENQFARIRRLEDEINAKMTRFLSEQRRIDLMEADFNRLLQTSQAVGEKLGEVTSSDDTLQAIQVQLRKINDALAETEEKYRRIEKKNQTLETIHIGVDRNFKALQEAEGTAKALTQDMGDLRAKQEDLRLALDKLRAETEQAQAAADRLGLLEQDLSTVEQRIKEMQVAREWIAQAETRMEKIKGELNDQLKLAGEITREENDGPQRGSNPVSIATRDSVHKLHRQGWTDAQIANTLKLSVGEVQLILEVPLRKN
ncbi:MAG: hypothetical protein LBC88_05995 [Spirochaetaceae bacterium]|jgi:chromosome segregation ATPase|nr:hypothetical protein [Spirochaetaceae bacterium]